MAVLKTTSPIVWPSAPMASPRKMLPSARARMAGLRAGLLKKTSVDQSLKQTQIVKKRDDVPTVTPLFYMIHSAQLLVDTLKREAYRKVPFWSTARCDQLLARTHASDEPPQLRPSTSCISYSAGARPFSHEAERTAPLAKVIRLEALWVISTRSPSAANSTV